MKTKHEKKILSIGSMLGAAVKNSKTRTIKMNMLLAYCNRLMRSYSLSDPKSYVEVTRATFEIWENLGDEHDNPLCDDEIEVLIEIMRLMAPTEFLSIDSKVIVSQDKMRKLIDSIEDVDMAVGMEFGTKSVWSRDKVHKYMMAKAPKIKTRDKGMSKARKKLKNKMKWAKKKRLELETA